jgi:hypothetical protein
MNERSAEALRLRVRNAGAKPSESSVQPIVVPTRQNRMLARSIAAAGPSSP